MATGVELALISSATSLVVALTSMGTSLWQLNQQKAMAKRQAAERERIVTLQDELTRRGSAEERKEERGSQAKDVLDHYRGPLLDAVWDLGHRIDGIRNFDFMSDHGGPSSPWHDDAVLSTVFRVAQYLAWHEIVRRKIQFLKYEAADATKRAADLLEAVRRVFAIDTINQRHFMIEREPQRAIAECMISTDSSGECSCIGYAEFCELYEQRFARWLGRFASGLELPHREESERLAMLHTTLAELVDHLDEEGRYSPGGWRARAPSYPDKPWMMPRETWCPDGHAPIAR